ncbi:hypothetical protein [Phenylobacterium sp. SCN 70-31]|uniref:hypothetical protein n=1 Tax=Phenylobacterium sp. SCN 70-31 TaxID=1660129 RepID=UPI00086D3199|nr:hypothetical protein [Phenylobacterium sp. SCN 70-31]ODT87594.1 MAG: hypothetical protein ABS78_11535 [Phenylobacterium sp. SCN 70-31]
MVTSIDTSVLLGFYQARAGIGVGTSALGTSTASKKTAPTAPWNQSTSAADISAATKAAMLGRRFVDESGAKLDLPGASGDYRKLFALYQGLSVLMTVTEQSGARGMTAADRSRMETTFNRGLKEILGYVGDMDLNDARVIQGVANTQAKTTLGVPRNKTEYVTPPLVSGSSDNVVPAFTGNVQFNIAVKRSGATINVPIDLSGMGAQPRTINNVVTYMNQQLEAAGVDTRMGTQRISGGPRTTTIGGKTVTIGTNPDQWALKVRASAGETITFSAPATAGAVYVAQDVGNPDPDRDPKTADATTAAQFLKFQTDTTDVPSPLQRTGEQNWVDGRIFSETLGPEVKTVRDTKVAADGSVYMLADVTSKIAGQEIRGDQDVALLKYDASGKLVFARTLGASDEASGLGLALSADGKIAVAGSVKGALGGVVDGPLNSTGAFDGQTDSFVSVYDADGQELWTQRRGARAADEATDVAFGDDGTVYVIGRTSSGKPGAAPIGGSDSYIEAFKPDAQGKVQLLFSNVFGTAGMDRPAGIVVDGTSIITASNEDGRAVLRRFDVSGGTPVLTSTRDLGELQGGQITGLALEGGQLYVAGSTNNPALNAGTVTRAHAGGSDAFVAQMSADLSPGGTLAYYGGAGDDRATSLAVAGGQVWIGGAAGTDLPGHPDAVGVKDGFLARLDMTSGTIDWSRRFTGKDGRAAPTSIAVDTSGASVLDRIGLPKGELDLTDSPYLTAVSSLRPGDQFTLKVSGRAQTITIDPKETLDTLAAKIRRASGFQAKVTIATAEGMRSLRIEPNTDRVVMEFGAGKTDRDALAMLGIPEGVIRKTVTKDGVTRPADGKDMLYGLSLERGLSISNDVEKRHTLAVLGKAMGVVRQIYKDLVQASLTPAQRAAQEAAKAASGPVPTYLSNQIANYQAALARLGG